MSFDEEWAELRLASARSDGAGAPAGDLVVAGEEIGPVGEVAAQLQGQLQEHGSLAVSESRNAGKSLREQDFSAGQALMDAADSWRSKAEALSFNCGKISRHLTDTLRTHAAGEQERVAAQASVGGMPNPSILEL